MIGKNKIPPRLARPIPDGRLSLLRHYLAARRGAVRSEYAFLFAFIVFVAVAGFVMLGNSIVSSFNGLSDHVDTANSQTQNPLIGSDDGGDGSDGDPKGGGSGNPGNGGSSPGNGSGTVN